MDDKLLSYKADPSYPKWLLPTSGMIKPKLISRDHIEEGIALIHEGLKYKKCKKNEAINVLRYFGLCGDAIDNIVMNGLNARQLRDAVLNRRSNLEEYNKFKDDNRENPSKYIEWKLPSSWFGEDHVRLYADVPMHLLFLGITKSVMIKATKWLTIKRHFSTFLSYTKTILEPIEKMNLDWCKLMKYPTTDKFGGWVSENYLGMARACSWFYSMIVYLPEQEPYEDPHPSLPLKEWSRQQLKGWLEARDISVTGNKMSDLLEIIQEYKDVGINPPIVYNTTIWQKDILQMFNVLNKMISYMMSMDTTRADIDTLEVIIRAFLIIYDKVDMGMDNKDEPSFMRQYNFLCLLNVPDNMRQFGSMRNIWEGGMVGEGYLRGMKRELKQGMIGSWQVWTLKNILEKDFYNDLITQKHKIKKGEFRLKLEKECIIHRNEEQAGKSYASGQPISGLIRGNDKDEIYIIFRKRDKLCYKTVVYETDKAIDWHLQTYYRIHLKDDTETISSDGEIEDIIDVDSMTGVLLLPRLCEEGYEKKHRNTIYCIIQSNWM
jgi:hypothetical protein